MAWASLPEPAVTRVLQHLSFVDRCKSSTVCRNWWGCFSSPSLWENTVFTFKTAQDEMLLTYARRYGYLIKNLSVEVDQISKANRANACELLRFFANLQERRLESFSLVFIGTNPMFYSGLEFVECFKELFKIGDRPQFLSVDLSKVKFSIGEELVDILTENNPNLQTLNIQSDALICKVSPSCIKRVLQRCSNLKDLSVASCSLTEDVLLMFNEQHRVPLEHLSLMIRREQKFAVPISSQCWTAIRAHLPGLRVSLGFDSTCPMDVICEVLKPEIPVYSITLAVYGPVEQDLPYLPIYYKDTVETVILHPTSNIQFHSALVDVAEKCRKLKTLLVYCVLPVNVIQRILDLCPEMKARGTYILKSEAEPEPNWVMAKDACKLEGGQK